MHAAILRADGGLLALFGLAGLTMDLLGYFAGAGLGPSATPGDPRVIGAVEAHGLAIIVAALLLGHAPARNPARWHTTAVVVHLLLGTCNVVFWRIFVDLESIPLGVVATSYHLVFIVANGVALFLLPSRPGVASPRPGNGA